jgi:methylenetetrahydrofolate dehydrogenase (NADP+) / methenyltetrahydrofolate cyclohydrolase
MILDGKLLAQSIYEKLQKRVAQANRKPGLGVLLVGDDPASQIYVRNKEKAAEKIGLLSRVIRLPDTATEHDVLRAVDSLNNDGAIDAFIVQLPLPKSMNANLVLQYIDPKKDADGLHPDNLGKLLTGMAAPRPCTPAGVMALLHSGRVRIAGQHAVVVGRSNIVGKPVALMLLAQDATVTICHSKTPDLAQEVSRAAIVVAAVGVPEIIRGAWIKEGAAVIDVGMNRLSDGKLVGDVEYTAAEKRAEWITPVPGGVGPMTIAMLLQNAVDAYELQTASKG